MADITLEPIIVETAVVTLAGDDYSATVSSAALTPSNVNPLVFKGINGQKKTRIPKADWTLDLDFAQDVKTAKSLTLYCFEHEGEVVEFTLTPVDGGPSFSGSVVCAASVIGGGGDNFLTATVSLPCDDKPEKVAAA